MKCACCFCLVRVGLLGLLLTACTSEEQNPQEVVVFAAASLRDAMEDMGAQFEAETDIEVVFNFAGSQILAQQILASTQADIYLSADAAWMDTVEDVDRIEAGTRHSLLTSTLVVIGHPERSWMLDAPCGLADLPFTYLAIGNPEAVPVGRYARTWLANQTCAVESLWNLLEDRTAPTPDVRAAVALVRAEPNVIGIVYKADYLAFAEQTSLLYEVSQTTGPRIEYVMAQIKDAPHPKAARRFLAYASSVEAHPLFEAHGFTMQLHETAEEP